MSQKCSTIADDKPTNHFGRTKNGAETIPKMRTCEYNIKIMLKTSDVEWIQLAQVNVKCRTPVNLVINFQRSIKGEEFPDQLSDCHHIKRDSAARSYDIQDGA